ncbi:hypothetical protein OSJ57_00035 [Sphingomonas sp. HH69]
MATLDAKVDEAEAAALASQGFAAEAEAVLPAITTAKNAAVADIGTAKTAAIADIAPQVSLAAANATLAGHYSNDDTNADVPGGPAGSRGSKYWAGQAALNGATATDMPLLNALSIRGNRARPANVTLNQLILLSNGNTTTVGSSGAYYRVRVGCRPGEQLVCNANTDAGNASTYAYRYVAKDGTVLGYYAGLAAFVSTTAAPANTFYCDFGFQTSVNPLTDIDIRGADEPDLSDDLDRELSALLGKNLYEHNDVQVGKAVQFAASTLQTLAGYNATAWFRVIPGQSLRANFATMTGSYGWQFAGRNKRRKDGLVGSSTPNTDVVVPAGCYWARVSYQVSAAPAAKDIRITLGTASAEVPAKASDVAITAIAKAQFDGFVDLGKLTLNRLILVNGNTSNVGSNGTFAASDWFPVVPGDQLISNARTLVTGNAVYGWHFAPIPNAPQNLIQGVVGTERYVGVTVPANCYWARTSVSQTEAHAYKQWRVWRAGQARGPLEPYNWMSFGDSLHGLGPHWQREVMDRTGLNLLYQDARGGRGFQHIFEMYQVPGAHTLMGDPVNGQSINGFLQSDMPQYGSGQTLTGTPDGQQINGGVLVAGVSSNFNFPPVGQTLAQSLATVDVVSFMLGANNGGIPAGTLADAAGTATVIGYLKYIVQAFLTAKPTIRVVPIILPYAGAGGGSDNVIAQAYRDYCDDVGFPYVDLRRRSGINVLTDGPGTATFLQGDKLHLLDAAHPRVGSLVADKFLEVMW